MLVVVFMSHATPPVGAITAISASVNGSEYATMLLSVWEEIRKTPAVVGCWFTLQTK